MPNLNQPYMWKLILDFLKLAFYVESWWGPAATTGIFIAAAITDWLDGYIARKVLIRALFHRLTYCKNLSLDLQLNLQIWCLNIIQLNLGTAFGAFLDPVADKVFSLMEILIHSLWKFE